MQNRYEVTDAELEIMHILWDKKECKLSEIISELNNDTDKNINTVKTLIRRLMLKGTIESRKINSRDVVYIPKIDKEKFLDNQNNNFLKKLYNGSTNKLLLNFVENKKVSKEELQRLIDILEGEEGD